MAFDASTVRSRVAVASCKTARVFWEPVEASDLPLKALKTTEDRARSLGRQVVRHSYYIVASWTAYKPFEMVPVRKGELYEVKVRSRGHMFFRSLWGARIFKKWPSFMAF